MLNKYIESIKTVFQSPWFRVDNEVINFPNGHKASYYIMRTGHDFVCIVPFYQGKLLVIREWRATIKEWNYEFPMGAVDEGENALVASERELKEETGYKANNWEVLGKINHAPGHSDQKEVVYLATEMEPLTGKPEENPSEMIELFQLTVSEFEEMIKTGKIKDGPTLAAWCLFKSKKEEKDLS